MPTKCKFISTYMISISILNIRRYLRRRRHQFFKIILFVSLTPVLRLRSRIRRQKNQRPLPLDNPLKLDLSGSPSLDNPLKLIPSPNYWLSRICVTFKECCYSHNSEGCVRCLQQVDIEYKSLKAKLQDLFNLEQQIVQVTEALCFQIVKVLDFVAKKESLQLPHGFTALQVSGSQAQTLSKLTLSMAIDTWKPEETRYFFELYAEERRKGNKVGTSMNKVGKTNIMEAFEQRFKKNFPDWRPYKSKYDTSRKKYIKIKTLTQNRTELGFDDMGTIDMSDDWWSERERECPGIRRSVCKKISNMDMFEAEFGGVVVTGAEGWSAQHGEASLNSRVGEDDGDDEADSQSAAETQALEIETQPQAPRQTQPSTQTHSGSSRAKRRRKEKDMVVEACVKRTEALKVKNKIAERMLE
ncbi:unnamed protein product, partial [Brassica oleracea]